MSLSTSTPHPRQYFHLLNDQGVEQRQGIIRKVGPLNSTHQRMLVVEWFSYASGDLHGMEAVTHNDQLGTVIRREEPARLYLLKLYPSGGAMRAAHQEVL